MDAYGGNEEESAELKKLNAEVVGSIPCQLTILTDVWLSG